VFKCKLSKLQLLYKKQLSIINDRLIYDRKKYLVKKESEKIEPTPTGKITLSSKEAELFKATKNYHAITQKVR